MSDIFDIIPQEKTKNKNDNNTNFEAANYIKLQAQFLSSSFGFYTVKFAQMIAEEASKKYAFFKTLGINKILRDIVKRYLLSDLELVYVGHIASLLDWNINSTFIEKKCIKFLSQNEEPSKQFQHLMFFLNLIAFFVKKYIGQLQEYQAIAQNLNQQSKGVWEETYGQWLKVCPHSIFRLSPREINLTYSLYSKNCQEKNKGKNYNSMVDKIMELSTTYAMIPGEIKDPKKRKVQKRVQNHNQSERQQQKQIADPFLFGRKIFKADEVSQIDFFKKSDIKNQFSEISNEFIDNPKPIFKKGIKLGHKVKQSQINNTVTDFFSKKKSSQLVINKRYAPQSTIGFGDPNLNLSLFDSKFCSSGSEIIPYPLRSNSNIFRSKLFE